MTTSQPDRAAGPSAGDSTGTAPVLLDVEDGVATITLNRPEAMNGLDVATKDLLRDTVHQVADDPAVRCVVLTGSGRAFCVGQDLKEHLAGPEGRGGHPALGRPSSSTTTRSCWPSPTMPKPVIAAVNGVAAGAGASLAFAADFRILVDSAGFNTSFAGVALSCDTGSSWTLPRLVGPAKAMELLYFPRTVSAAGGPRARAGQPGRHRGRARRRPWASSPHGSRAGPDGRVRLDPPGGGVLRRAPAGGVARLRGREDGAAPAAPRTTSPRSTRSWRRRSRSSTAAEAAAEAQPRPAPVGTDRAEQLAGAPGPPSGAARGGRRTRRSAPSPRSGG